ncbi:MAG: hypothetical protein Q4B03_03290 [Lachnospiraceae bacterium]|nr:hypothetical protein [Lachnospiraceae bacterium]
MARIFKYIFRILLIAYVALILALVIPPLIGYTTATVQQPSAGNQSVGTVDYAKRIPLEELAVGDRILVTGSGSVNVYTVQAVDVERAVVVAADSENPEIPVRSYVYRVIVAVPMIGYVVIALQSLQGVLALAAAAAVLLLLCILTGVWSRNVKERKLAEKDAKKSAGKEPEGDPETKASAGEDGERAFSPRAEAYFAARRAEQNRPAAIEEYEDFPGEQVENNNGKSSDLQTGDEQQSYFDDDEEDDALDAWLHDDVDEEDLFSGMSNNDATESLMATARLFAMNRAAQLKSQIASEESEPTRVLSTDEIISVKESDSDVMNRELQSEKTEEGKRAVKVKTSPAKEIEVDKVINLKELKELDEDSQQIILTINIKVVPE